MKFQNRTVTSIMLGLCAVGYVFAKKINPDEDTGPAISATNLNTEILKRAVMALEPVSNFENTYQDLVDGSADDFESCDFESLKYSLDDMAAAILESQAALLSLSPELSSTSKFVATLSNLMYQLQMINTASNYIPTEFRELEFDITFDGETTNMKIGDVWDGKNEDIFEYGTPSSYSFNLTKTDYSDGLTLSKLSSYLYYVSGTMCTLARDASSNHYAVRAGRFIQSLRQSYKVQMNAILSLSDTVFSESNDYAMSDAINNLIARDFKYQPQEQQPSDNAPTAFREDNDDNENSTSPQTGAPHRILVTSHHGNAPAANNANREHDAGHLQPPSTDRRMLYEGIPPQQNGHGKTLSSMKYSKSIMMPESMPPPMATPPSSSAAAHYAPPHMSMPSMPSDLPSGSANKVGNAPAVMAADGRLVNIGDDEPSSSNSASATSSTSASSSTTLTSTVVVTPSDTPAPKDRRDVAGSGAYAAPALNYGSSAATQPSYAAASGQANYASSGAIAPSAYAPAAYAGEGTGYAAAAPAAAAGASASLATASSAPLAGLASGSMSSVSAASTETGSADLSAPLTPEDGAGAESKSVLDSPYNKDSSGNGNDSSDKKDCNGSKCSSALSSVNMSYMFLVSTAIALKFLI